MRPSASRLSMNRTKQLNRRSWHGRQVPPLRAPSVASTHSATMSMATARTSMPRRLSVSSSRATPTVESVSGMRPQSSASMRSQGQERRPLPLQAMLREPLLDESLDNTINPWVHHPSIQRYHLDDGHTSDDSIEDERLADRQAILDSRFLASPSPHPTSQQPPPVNSIPRHDIPTISSQDTSIRSGRATPSSHSLAAIAEISGPMSTPKPSDESIESIGKIPALSLSEPHSQMGSALPPSEGSQPKRVSKPLPPDQYTSVVALGPATKRALESLQMEIFALNERIDGLRQELMERDQRRRNKRAKKRLTGNQSGSSNGNDDDSQYDSAFEGWKWVIKAAVRHAFVNLATAICLFLLLYRQGNPIAYVLDHEMWPRHILLSQKNHCMVTPSWMRIPRSKR
ncbi:uncharacterized protein BYT42DRAFT_623 [Radiomyces spectabilis]|uniref:uncharacterized protein n=1 Tax=Radiomyces spectabilis TaxID=64574 RepID=UPI00221F905A|nr:uncharacterized protein BYT42DRAFT_623 [Radiomyces spectabilis]KAI8393275.1 hypothetical protein BYT42DRAFT_623 [Radiomyces spectabilis]